MHLKSLTGKSPGYDDISFYVLKKCFSSLCEPLNYLLNLSIEKYIFPDDLKISKVTPIYKANGKSNLSNYKPIYVLLYFSKLLKQIMYNRLYQYLNEKNFFEATWVSNKTLYWTGYIQLVDQILESFENNKYTLGVLLTYPKPLIQSIIQYFFKNCNYMVYS